MVKNFHTSFRQDLAKIMNKYNNLVGGSLINFGTKLGEDIAKEVETICDYLDSVVNNQNFEEQLVRKYQKAKIKPQVYSQNGYDSCDDLFFEHKFYPKGTFTVIGFYIPCIFKTNSQRKELSTFTSEWETKLKNKESIEFYFAACHMPEN